MTSPEWNLNCKINGLSSHFWHRTGSQALILLEGQF